MSIGGNGRGGGISRAYRPLAALVTAGLLSGAAVLALSAAHGAVRHPGSPARRQTTTASPASPAAKAKANWPTAWQPPGRSGAGPNPVAVCDPTSTAAANCDGFAVAVSGDTAVVAAPGTKHKAGVAYVLQFVHIRIGGQVVRSGWTLEATLPDPRGASDDEYAWAVAVYSGKPVSYIAIGGNDNNGKRDIVYIYDGAGKIWHLQAEIDDPGTTYVDMFGDALAISSTTLVVGASCVDFDSGAADIYQRVGSRWVLEASISDPLDRQYDSFGQTAAISGGNVLIGAIGQVYMYTVTPQRKWRLTATLQNPGNPADNYGNSVAISGATAIVGAPGPVAGAGSLQPGVAYMYKESGTKWSLTGKLGAPRSAQGHEYGYAVAMTATNIIVSMPLYGAKTDCGTAFAYKLSRGKWILLEQLKDPKCVAGANFGYSAELSGTIVIIGAPGLNNYQGAAYELSIP